MSALASYANILWAEPLDDDVGKRNRAISALVQEFKSITPRKATVLAAAIVASFADGGLSGEFSTTVEKAITIQSEAFRLKGKELQGIVCAAVAALELLRGKSISAKWGASTALAATLWSGLAVADATWHAPFLCNSFHALSSPVADLLQHFAV